MFFSREELIGLTVLEDTESLRDRGILTLSHLSRFLRPGAKVGTGSSFGAEKDTRFGPVLELPAVPMGDV